MNTDIRVHVEFWGHSKTRRMIRALGLEGPISLQILWCYAAKNRPDGILLGMDEIDIEEAAGWPPNGGANGGLPRVGEFVAYCLENRWIDRPDKRGPMELHEWAEHNPWATDYESRKQDGLRGAHERHHVKRNSLKPKTCEFCRALSPPNSPPKSKELAPLKPPQKLPDAPAPYPAPQPFPSPVEEEEREQSRAREAEEPPPVAAKPEPSPTAFTPPVVVPDFTAAQRVITKLDASKLKTKPPDQIVIAWLSEFDEALILETIDDGEAGYAGKHFNYLEQMLITRRDNPEQRPGNRRAKGNGNGSGRVHGGAERGGSGEAGRGASTAEPRHYVGEQVVTDEMRERWKQPRDLRNIPVSSKRKMPEVPKPSSGGS